MHITNDNRLKKLIVIDGRLLINPSLANERTADGLYLPPGVQDKEKLQQDMSSKQVQVMPFPCR